MRTLLPVCRLPMMKTMRDSLIVDGSNLRTRMALMCCKYTTHRHCVSRCKNNEVRIITTHSRFKVNL